MPRFDRFLTLYCFRYMRNFRPIREKSIPILMYHSISDKDEQAVHPYYRTCTSPKIFAQQLSWLREHGYTAISLVEAVDLLSRQDNALGREEGQAKYVVITFDDGFKDFYTTAFPMLNRYGLTATVFLPTSFIDNENTSVIGQAFLSWPQVCELIRSGIAFGSHTVSHRHVARLLHSEREQELWRSKKIIEDRTGSPVQSFSFPYAFPEDDKDFVADARNTLQACGYSCAVTTRIGTATQGDDPFILRRIPINSDDDRSLFLAKMEGGYDWLHFAQYMAKRVRGALRVRSRRSLARWMQ